MKFTDIFIQRPVLAMTVSLLIFVLGLKSIFQLDLRQFPKTENTVISVTTAYPGASAQLIEGFITQPIQTAVASADGIDYMSSSSVQGVSTISLKLRLNFDSAVAFADVLAKVNSVKNQLPSGSQDPVITKSTGSSVALLYVNYASEKMTSSQIYDYLVRVVQPKFQSVAGVSTADILGGNPFAMRIWLNPEKMAAFGVTTDDVTNALRANSFLSAPGSLKGQYTLTNISADTDLHTVEEYNQIVVRENNHTFVRMKDVSMVELGSESYSSSVSFNGIKGVFVGINALPTANPLTVIQGIRASLPDIEKQLPPGITQTVVYDSTKFISASLHDVIFTLLLATCIVIVVIFLFLGSLRSVLIPVVTIPLSIVGVCVFMNAFHYSINLLTLLAMVLAIGLVVDDAIVVVENIHRHMEEGKSPLDAALLGAREIATAVIAMTITLAAVYAPIGLMGGLTGALFKEFALTLAASVCVSGLVALTLSPMMCSKVLTVSHNKKSFSHWSDMQFDRLQKYYARKLSGVLDFRPVVLVFGSVILVSVYFLFVLTPKELAPVEDQGFLFGITTAPTYANLKYLEKYSNELGRIFRSVPEQESTFIVNGISGENGGIAGLVLKPWSDRHRKAKEVQQAIQKQANNIAGIKAFVISLPDLPTGSSGLPVQFVIKTTDDYHKLYDIMQDLQNKARKSGLFLITDSDLTFDSPNLDIHLDRSKAAEMGISMQTLGDAFTTLLGGNYVNYFSIAGRSYKVIPQLPDSARRNPDELKRTYVRNGDGTLVPLSNFVSFSNETTPRSLNQFQQLNAATLSCVMFPGQTTQTGLNFLVKTAKEILPRGVTYDFSGDSRTQVQEGNALAVTFVFALILIFLVLAAQFESFRDPLIILVSVPMAICGALIPMNLGLANVNIYTEIGLVTLIGLITKHGILMVEFANQLRRSHGLDIRSAIEKSAATRLRPILMTTAAMVMGVVPLVFASGAGAASRHDIGIVIFFGLTIGTLFTLFIVPTMYTYITSRHSLSAEIR